ncbi:phenylacetic acid degradation protein [Alicyclobacillus dauci]|uniref:Phenylacetic acid degradation protein n=1 Tax=Alicyclobacillus dauci TaxID=1475485 RepID=A0ABY6YX53_9BACL|nr:phenylacetic acid degradation protein [Alicyclobacillus dauci]WAH35172.1 phenylacetic acid degradation protein [Alicyclobacillus dauci]
MSDTNSEEHYPVYEVFVQKSQLDSHVHVGSVLAPNPTLALQVARENFLRRDKAVNIWVVPQTEVHGTSYDEEHFFAREFDRSYREVGGYADNARRWKAFKQKMMTIDELSP